MNKLLVILKKTAVKIIKMIFTHNNSQINKNNNNKNQIH